MRRLDRTDDRSDFRMPIRKLGQRVGGRCNNLVALGLIWMPAPTLRSSDACSKTRNVKAHAPECQGGG
jgi:hypothetical protein